MRMMGAQVVAHTSRSVVVFSNSDEELSGSATMVRFTMLSTGVMTSVNTSSLAAMYSNSRRILSDAYARTLRSLWDFHSSKNEPM